MNLADRLPPKPLGRPRWLRARVSLLRRIGVHGYFTYWRARREGVVIDYARVLTPEQIAVLEEHFEEVPWRTNQR